MAIMKNSLCNSGLGEKYGQILTVAAAGLCFAGLSNIDEK
jgi:hypothetical protein